MRARASLLAALLVTTQSAARATELSLEGFGPLRNRELRTAITLLLDDGRERAEFDALFVEDAALVLNSELVEEGYFSAEVEAMWRAADGAEGRVRLDARLTESPPRDLRATSLRLIARPGVRAVVERVEFSGLSVIKEEDARRYFMPESGWFTPDAARAWSEARMRRAAVRLRDTLLTRGHLDATVAPRVVRLDPATGRAELAVDVFEGPVWTVAEAAISSDGAEPDAEARAALDSLIAQPWAGAAAQDAAQAIRRAYQRRGFPDVAVEWGAEPITTAEPADGTRAVRVTARTRPGEATRLAGVRFDGVARTRPELLRERSAELRAGDVFDPVKVEEARLRLARLGVFRRVETDAEPAGPGERTAVFSLREEVPWETAWMLGYGSYEQLRGGVEVTRRNLWGLAHRTRFEAVQSFKGTRADYRYTVPTFFKDTVEATGRVFGLSREEPSFDRREYGAAVEARREVPWIGALGTAGFSYEVLRASDVELGATTPGADEAAVAALDLGLTRDRRDNPIRPTSGSRWSAQAQLARPELGGEVSYERVELAWSWHRPLGEDRWLHLGVSQGWIFDGADAPLNKLFYPGGESSIRGYGEGEATQRDATGRYVGVRSATLANLELEQRVTGRWSAVLFLDVLGTAVNAEDWPGEETLGSAGAGVRYQSPIGPVRLEYGRNLKRRPGDPSGALHFSIGFPF